jgi:hypothetical protein
MRSSADPQAVATRSARLFSTRGEVLRCVARVCPGHALARGSRPSLALLGDPPGDPTDLTTFMGR